MAHVRERQRLIRKAEEEKVLTVYRVTNVPIFFQHVMDNNNYYGKLCSSLTVFT